MNKRVLMGIIDHGHSAAAGWPLLEVQARVKWLVVFGYRRRSNCSMRS